MIEQDDQQDEASAEIVGLDDAEIFPSQSAIFSFRAESVERVRLANLWTDWSVRVFDAAGAVVTNRVSDAGEVVLDWESLQESVELSITIDPPTDTYAGGAYAIDVVAEGGDSVTTRTATIDMDRSFDESLYVDAEAGSDDNPGTETEPFETIQKAMNRVTDYKNNGRSVSVEIAPGTYRESVEFANSGVDDGNHPHVLVEGAGPEATVITGSGVFEEWRNEGNDRFSHEWTRDWGVADDPTGGYITDCENHSRYCADSPDLVLRREMVFVDGERMRQVLSVGAMEPGTYYVTEDDTEDDTVDPNTIYLEPPEDVTLSESTVEVSVRPDPPSRGGWFTQNENNVTVRNLGVQRVATPWTQGKGAMVLEGDDITAENVRVVDNNYTGVFPGGVNGSENVTLRNVTLDRNGQSGVGPFRVTNFLIEDSEVNANNWRGALGGYTGWSVGNKFFQTRRVTVRDTTFANNQSRGLWFDRDHEDVLLEDVELRDNFRDNIYLEYLQGPVTLRRVLSTGSREYSLLLSDAENITVEDSQLVDNDQGGIHVSGRDSGRSFTTFPEDEDREITVYTREFSLRDSVISGVNDGVRAGNSDSGRYLIGTTFGLCDPDDPDTPDAWCRFRDTYEADNNTWSAGQENAFELPGNDLVDFEAWQNETGEDQNSVWTGEQSPVSEELLLHWQLDSDATDSSGNGYDADTIAGSPTYGVPGNVGDAVELDAPNDGDFIGVTPPGSFSVDTSEFTVAWWHYPRSASDFNQKVGAHGDFNWEQWQFNANSDGGVAVGFDYENNDRFRTDAGTLDLDTWQHFAFTYDGTEAVFYEDGSVLFGPTAMDNRDPMTRFVLSRVEGRIDDVRIYGGALSADEVDALYSLGL